MDSTIYTNSGAPLITPWSPRGMSTDAYNAQVKADQKKQEIDSDAAKVFEQPTMKADDQERDFLRAKIQGIMDRLKVLQKLFSNDGREMARAVTEIFKELKAALKEYKDLAGKELGGVDGTVAQAMAPPTPGDSTGDATDDKGTGSDTATDKADATPPPEAPAATDGQTSTDGTTTVASTTAPSGDTSTQPAAPDDRAGLYKAVEQKVRETIGEGAMDFLNLVKSVVKTIEDKLLSKARVQIAAMKPDKDLEKVVKDLNDSEKDLNQAMDDMDSDLKNAVPGLGMHLDVAA